MRAKVTDVNGSKITQENFFFRKKVSIIIHGMVIS